LADVNYKVFRVVMTKTANRKNVATENLACCLQ